MTRKWIATALLAACAPAFAGGDVLGLIGQRSLNDEQWERIEQEQQTLFGVAANFTFGPAPVGLAVAMHASAEDEDGLETAVVDFSVGGQFMPTRGAFRPFAGAGVASVGVAVDDNFGVDESDQSFGYYVNGGALYRLSRHFSIGAELRWLGGTDLEIEGVEFNADSFSAAFMIGGSWGE
jgi:opacity protein-like surface antigen